MTNKIREHYEAHFGLFVKMATPRVANQCTYLAEEAVQEAYTRLYEVARVRPVEFLNAYLISILSRVIQDINLSERLRGMSGDKRAEHGLDFHLEDLSEIELEESDMQRSYLELHKADVVKMISERGPRSKKILDLFFFKGYSHKEIAEILNIAEQTSKNTVCNFIRKLK